jgi:metal-responsive CopG/Arc/MetJ family transcriptional regulator
MTIQNKTNKAKTAISIENKLLQETDLIARELSVSRSQVVSSALDEYIQHYRNQRLLNQINDACADGPDTDETGSLEIIRSHMKKIVKTEEWK